MSSRLAWSGRHRILGGSPELLPSFGSQQATVMEEHQPSHGEEGTGKAQRSATGFQPAASWFA